MREPLGPDKMDAGVVLPFVLGRTPSFVRNTLVFLLKYVVCDQAAAAMLSASGLKSAGQYMDLVSSLRSVFV